MYIRFTLLFTTLLMALLFQNCGKVSFSNLTPTLYASDGANTTGLGGVTSLPPTNGSGPIPTATTVSGGDTGGGNTPTPTPKPTATPVITGENGSPSPSPSA